MTKNLTGPDYKQCCLKRGDCRAGSGILQREPSFAGESVALFRFRASLPVALYNFRAFAKVSFPGARTSTRTHMYVYYTTESLIADISAPGVRSPGSTRGFEPDII